MLVDYSTDVPLPSREILPGFKQHVTEKPLTLADPHLNHGAEGPEKDGLDSSNESESEGDKDFQPQHITERRRIQNAIFSSWFVGKCTRLHKSS